MKKTLLLFFVLSQVEVFGQPFSEGQKAVINAENTFAGLSKSTNTRDAFMEYLSDSTIMFADNKPVAGIKLWVDKKPDSTLLFWWPVFAGASTDGALGFSTGPWEWSRNRQSPAQGFGYYATIWKKDAGGKWKMAVDMGISFPEAERAPVALKISATGLVPADKKSSAREELLAMDKAYNAKLKDSSVSFLAGYFTTDGHLLRKGHKPYTKPEEFASVNERGQKFIFELAGGGIAASQDLGYAYGTAKAEVIKDGKTVTEDKSYLRAWKKEKNGWKIVLDVVSSQ